MFLEPPDQIAADNLRVIEIELDLDVVPPNPADQVGGMLNTCEEVVGPVARVDWLDQELEVVRSCQVSSPGRLSMKTLSAAGRRSGGTAPARQWIETAPIAIA